MLQFLNKQAMKDKFLKPYNASETEPRVYTKWEKGGYFNPDTLIEKGLLSKNAEPFVIALPPPNVTGNLHLGHAFEDSIQDTMTRYARMSGKRTLWIPGTDHAAIATTAKLEATLYKEDKKTRFDIGREEFLKRANDFAQKSHDTIVNQIRRMGASLDWSREAYTFDEKRSVAVRTAFKRMYDAGLIYRGERIVNWDPRLGLTISDDEVEYVEQETSFYYLKYGPFTIGTARPETKFGDKYVVMHPNDKRYSKYKHGDKIELEWINGQITATIIKDESIDMDFGTGVMTITPWHDATDFDIAERHSLDKEPIIDLKGKLLPIAGEFEGLYIKKARPLIVEKLQKKGLVEKVDNNYKNRIATNSRGGEVIEPQILKQWFIDVNKEFVLEKSKIPSIKSGSKITLKELLRKVVQSGDVTIIPERFEKTYFHWIDNLRDWCISRQIWFGHRIPVWYRSKDGTDETLCTTEDPKENGWKQDPDTLDTWFSSSLWTFSILGWPEETDDLRVFHPTSVINPGYEILFLWVARMILMSGFLLGEVPFKTAFIHGILRDEKGRKFSKSLGNGIDPIEVADKYGADALRMALLIGVSPGNDSSFSEQKIKAYKHFSNKIWNIARFVLSNTEDLDYENKPDLTKLDVKTIEEFDALIKDLTEDMEKYNFYLAAEKLYHYVWHKFADVIIEESKPILSSVDEKSTQISRKWTLMHILERTMRALHPFMPFITEEIWGELPIKDKKLLIIERWSNTD